MLVQGFKTRCNSYMLPTEVVKSHMLWLLLLKILKIKHTPALRQISPLWANRKPTETKLKYIRVPSLLLLLCDSFLIFPWLTLASLWMAAIETDWGDAAAEHAPGQGDAGVYQPTTGECVCAALALSTVTVVHPPPLHTHKQTILPFFSYSFREFKSITENTMGS